MKLRITAGRRAAVAGIGVGMLLLALALTLGLAVQAQGQERQRTNAVPERYTYAELADRVMPSIVTIYVRTELTDEQREAVRRFRRFFERREEDPFRRFFDPQPQPGRPGEPEEEESPDGMEMPMPQRSGSGIIISPDGHIITNWHVVGNLDENAEIRVVFADDTEVRGEDIEYIDGNEIVDLAILRVDPSLLQMRLQPIEWGDSDQLRIGETVAALGSPLDLRQSITHGIVSAKGRNIDEVVGLGEMIQTDAVINPGSSGGALINMDGQLVGVNRLITTTTGMWSGYGFAIPANDARFFADMVMREGRATYGYIGISMGRPGVEDTPQVRRALGIDPDTEGVLVQGVSEGGPAEEAGMQQYDLITHVGNRRIGSNRELLRAVMTTPVGESVSVQVQRGGGDEVEEMTLQLRIAPRPPMNELMEQMQEETPEAEPESPQTREMLGLSVEPIQSNGMQGLRVTRVQPESLAAQARLRPDDIITNVNGRAVSSVEELREALGSRTMERGHVIHLRRGGRPLVIVITQQ